MTTPDEECRKAMTTNTPESIMDSHVFEYYRDQFDYDPATGILIRRKGQFAGSVQRSTSNGYIMVFVGGRMLKAHRLIWMLYYKCNAPVQLDHINGVRSDNRIGNLRAATATTNAHNRGNTKKRKHNLPKGVLRSRKRFKACIYVDNNLISVGTFATPEEAAIAYNVLAIKHHGEFARLNYV